MTELEAAVERVWPGQETHVEVLGGGITNHNLKVEVDGEVFVLRVAGKDTNLLGIDRSNELAATEAAAAAGIGPDVVAFVEPEGWLVTRFIAGETPPLKRMREPDMVGRVAQVLRDRSCARRHDPGGVRLGARNRATDRVRAWRRRATAMPQRPFERELPR